jgi:hypothetical protein
MVFQYIEPFYFILSFSLGVFLSYIFTPKPQIIIKYPTPQNAGKITYMDDGGVCYRYEAIEVNCPTDKTKIKQIPLQ